MYMPEPTKPKTIVTPSNQKQSIPQTNSKQILVDIVDEIVKTIDGLSEGLKAYPIRELVKHAEEFGPYLKRQKLETNQVRKFLDAVNQITATLAKVEDEKFKYIQERAEAEIEKIRLSVIPSEEKYKSIEQIQDKAEAEKENLRFSKIEVDVVLLKPKLAYAAARQKAAKPLSEVMSAAINKVYTTNDFKRLVQLIESIIAYHKAEGGK